MYVPITKKNNAVLPEDLAWIFPLVLEEHTYKNTAEQSDNTDFLHDVKDGCPLNIISYPKLKYIDVIQVKIDTLLER